MKIGILTFHSQLNYGGVLQCWALKTVLEGMGHEVVVVDRWLDERNAHLWQEFAGVSLLGWMKFFVRGMLGCGDFGKMRRTVRTMCFLKKLNLSEVHFYDWTEVNQTGDSSINGLDLLVVGSDQVWHYGNWGYPGPEPYLLENAPRIKAISYAASFGMKEIPNQMLELYKRGLARFSAISCREREGVEICRGLGFDATHVVDPTLLVEANQWMRLVNVSKDENKHAHRRNLVCYFMNVELDAVIPLLERFAVKENCRVEVLLNQSLRPLPHSFKRLLDHFWHPRVKICRGYGPVEFVRAFSNATWALADSFHAMMFSSLFGKNLRVIRPSSDARRVMFSRIEEFASLCIEGNPLVDSVDIALESFSSGEVVKFNQWQIGELCQKSLDWLKSNVC